MICTLCLRYFSVFRQPPLTNVCGAWKARGRLAQRPKGLEKPGLNYTSGANTTLPVGQQLFRQMEKPNVPRWAAEGVWPYHNSTVIASCRKARFPANVFSSVRYIHTHRQFSLSDAASSDPSGRLISCRRRKRGGRTLINHDWGASFLAATDTNTFIAARDSGPDQTMFRLEKLFHFASSRLTAAPGSDNCAERNINRTVVFTAGN